MKSLLIKHATVITPEATLHDCAVEVEDGIIVRIGSQEPLKADYTIDASNRLLLPGIIDVHTDALDMEIMPRPRADIPVVVAFRELERKMSGSGFTTVFHSLHLGYNVAERNSRSKFSRKEIFESVHELSGKKTLLKNKIHLRFEVSGIYAYDTCFELIDRGFIDLISIMDHTPGQGQTSKESFIKQLTNKGKSVEQALTEYEEMIQLPKIEGEQLEKLVQHARNRNIHVASHDDDTIEKVKYMYSLGVNICEFPINKETARYATELGMHVVGGASNILRGGSISGNLSMLQAVKEGFINTLCSDYYPPAILHAAWKLAEEESMDWNKVASLISLNPAKAVNLHEQTGSIEIGKTADLILVKSLDGIPMVTHTIVDGEIVSQAEVKKNAYAKSTESVWL